MGNNGRDPEKQVLVLQGGGALGAYQAGAYEALCGSRACPGLGRRHFHRRHQRRDHRRQSPRAVRRAAAPILGPRVEPADAAAARERRCLAQDLQRGERGAGGIDRRARLLRAALPARRRHAARLARGDQHLRHEPAQGDAARARRFRSAEFRRHPLQRRRRAGPHRQHEIFRHRARRQDPPRAHHGERRVAARLPARR